MPTNPDHAYNILLSKPLTLNVNVSTSTRSVADGEPTTIAFGEEIGIMADEPTSWLLTD